MTAGRLFEIEVLAWAKGRERYVLLFDPDRREEVARTLGRWAADPDLSLTWSDAAMLVRRLQATTQEVRAAG